MAISFQRPHPAAGGLFGSPGNMVGNLVAPASVMPMAGTPVEAVARLVSPAAADTVAQQRTLAGTILAELYRYLAANAAQHPALAGAIPVLRDAVAEYAAGQSADPFSGARKVFAVIQQARASDASIPDT